MDNQPPNCCAIILAAGRSERMGRPKQLLQYKGKCLLQHAIDEAKRSDAGTVMVVLGYDAERILAGIVSKGVRVVENNDWQSGMASSIAAAIDVITVEQPETDAVMLMVCDQPFLDAALLNQLIAKHIETGKPIVASEYGDTRGIPVLFGKGFFDQLRQLKGDAGAKKLISQNPGSVATISFPLGDVDIDTPEAYQKLKHSVI